MPYPLNVLNNSEYTTKMAKAAKATPQHMSRPSGPLVKNRPLIVQCPACQTKFSVPSSLLHGVDTPRFHCSRCDYIFALEADAGRSVEKPIGTLGEDSLFETNNSKTETTKQPIKPSSFAPKPSPTADTDRITKDSWSLLGEESPEDLTPLKSVANSEAASAADALPDDFFESNNQQFIDNDPNQIEFKFPPAPRRREIQTGAEEESNGYKNGRSSQFSAEPFDADLLKTSYRSELSGPERANQLDLESQPPPLIRRISPWKGSLYLIAPMVVALVFLAIYAYSFRASAGQNTAELISSNLPQVAPARLFIDQLTYRVESLSSGESVPVLSGKITNNTDQTFREIIVEGLAFDSLGRNIARTKTQAASSLAKTRIKSLSLEMIEDIQKRKAPQRFELRPGAEQEFSVALFFGESSANKLIGSPISRIYYYSARIYSVREK